MTETHQETNTQDNLPENQPERCIEWIYSIRDTYKLNPLVKYCYFMTLYKVVNKKTYCLGTYTYKTVKKAKEDLTSILLILLSEAVEKIDLDSANTRKRLKWCPDYHKIFKYHSEDQQLHLEISDYPVRKLVNLLRSEFLGFRMKYDIVKSYQVDKDGNHSEDSDYELDSDVENHVETEQECAEREYAESVAHVKNPIMLFRANKKLDNHFL
jgi:hypothetical protein